MERVYVQVDSKRMENGDVVPLAIVWADGRVWNIDEVVHSCVSPDGEFEGIRYTVLSVVRKSIFIELVTHGTLRRKMRRSASGIFLR